ncbi:hypothetical protein [Marinivivus vitaminiproducens]|uniref:hypothetical protein n=1 Tax=Marinivivus vitaminiproducens TaxID=3035935 RepID=UPI00279C5C1C|nr:hypothetical protein P4R82_09650 [Geminicoccaceae bacterium SCSIO 64248]
MRSFVLLALCLASLAGLSGWRAAEAQELPPYALFVCRDGRQFEVNFNGDDALVTARNQRFQFRRAEAAGEGMSFANPDNPTDRLSLLRQRATLTLGPLTYDACNSDDIDDGQQWAGPEAETYRCVNERRFEVRFVGEQAEISAEGGKYEANRIRGSMASRYEGNGGLVRLYAQGERAELRVGEERFENCIVENVRPTTTRPDLTESVNYTCPNQPEVRLDYYGSRQVTVVSEGVNYAMNRIGPNVFQGTDSQLRIRQRSADLRLGQRYIRDCRPTPG